MYNKKSHKILNLRGSNKLRSSSSQTSTKASIIEDNRSEIRQFKVNRTGLPDKLKSGIEQLSGHSMDDVKVHYNSSKPAQLNAHAYAQGSEIHVASGQEKHLPHEAWHVVQQKQGRVKPTMQLKNKVNINDDSGLEKEADMMGEKALQLRANSSSALIKRNLSNIPVFQRKTEIHYNTKAFHLDGQKREVAGYQMKATLDPKEPVHGSSPGSSVQSDLMQNLKDRGYKRMIRGHLLNGQLGGLGIAANLFPITSQANSKHKNYVENKIKDKVNQGYLVNYSVNVNSAYDITNPNADFVCHANAAGWTLNQTIHSVPGKSTVRGNTQEGGVSDPNAGTMSFASKNFKANTWGEVGSGYNDFDHGKSAGKSTISLEGNKVEGNDMNIYLQGVHYNSGEIRREDYARELIGKVDWGTGPQSEINDESASDYLNDKIDGLESAGNQNAWNLLNQLIHVLEGHGSKTVQQLIQEINGLGL